MLELIISKDIWNQFFSITNTFDVKDFIDICFVAFIVYNAIRIMRETRAETLIKGVILLALAYLFSWLLDLDAMSFIIRSVFSQWVIVILIILFQPEVRRALEQMGKSKLSRLTIFGPRREDRVYRRMISEALNEVCQACAVMSERHIGALLVWERNTALGDIISTGTLVDAHLTGNLVMNIFFPNSPLHDGALVVREGRISAAGCILPLTKRTDVEDDLGTRHRAAIGISEESDALVIVVSEETGGISLADNGDLHRDLQQMQLYNILRTDLLGDDIKKESSLKKWLFKGSNKHEKK